MRDSISLGPTPSGESCQQLGAADYDEIKARDEVRRFRDLCIATFGPPPGSARYRITSNSHDFGVYLDLEIVFNDEDEDAIEYAYRVENNTPEYWPDPAELAHAHLQGAGHTPPFPTCPLCEQEEREAHLIARVIGVPLEDARRLGR